MKRIPGTDLWVPDYEKQYLGFEHYGKKSLYRYQENRLLTAYKICPQKKFAIDVGANIGLITLQLNKTFESIFCFEPDPTIFKCLESNVGQLYKIHLYNVALGDKEHLVDIFTDKKSCGNNYLIPGNRIKVKTLDSFDLPGCDLLKIDTEGYEYFVIKGALETIKKFHPVIILEEKNLFSENGELREDASLDQHRDIPLYAARRLLEDIGYSIFARLGHDFVMGFTGRHGDKLTHQCPDSELPALDDEPL